MRRGKSSWSQRATTLCKGRRDAWNLFNQAQELTKPRTDSLMKKVARQRNTSSSTNTYRHLVTIFAIGHLAKALSDRAPIPHTAMVLDHLEGWTKLLQLAIPVVKDRARHDDEMRSPSLTRRKDHKRQACAAYGFPSSVSSIEKASNFSHS